MPDLINGAATGTENAMRDAIGECEQAGYASGLAAGLTLALGLLDAGAAPGQVAALPAALVPAGMPAVRHDLAAGEGISLVRPAARRRPPDGELAALGARLGAARLGVTRALMDRVIEHLSGRQAGGEPVIRKQLVQGALADARVAIEAARWGLRAARPAGPALAALHDQITATDWELARLLGASGYAAGTGLSPGRRAWVSRLVASCWVARERAA
jgi:hypothetical protein